jgi:hypothetical protein
MLKSLSRGFSRFFTTERVIILVVFLILGWALLQYSGSKSLNVDSMETGAPVISTKPAIATEKQVPASSAPASSAPASSAPSASGAPSTSSATYSSPLSVKPQDLLPQDQHSQWATLNPVSQGNIAAPDLLQAGYHIGLDTIGQTLRNANLQEDPILLFQRHLLDHGIKAQLNLILDASP